MLGKRCAIWILVIVCCAGMWSCSSHRLEEAQATVATADSLWHNGQCLSDSAQLAQAYHTLHRRRAVYPDEYAHACYHYGKRAILLGSQLTSQQPVYKTDHKSPLYTTDLRDIITLKAR